MILTPISLRCCPYWLRYQIFSFPALDVLATEHVMLDKANKEAGYLELMLTAGKTKREL